MHVTRRPRGGHVAEPVSNLATSGDGAVWGRGQPKFVPRQR